MTNLPQRTQVPERRPTLADDFPVAWLTLVVLLATPLAAAEWKAAADPPAVKVQPRIAADLAIPVVQHPVFGGQVLYPTAPSPFVLTGLSFASDRCEVWDLQQRRMVGRYIGPINGRGPIALSPDGKHLALVKTGIGAHRSNVVQLITIETGAVFKEIEVDNNPFGPQYVDFAGPGRFLVGVNRDGSNRFDLWDFTKGDKGERVYTIPWSEHFRRSTTVISPGMRLLAILLEQQDNHIVIFDLKTGEKAGELTYPGASAGHRLRCDGLAFAPEGDEIAGVFSGGDRRIFSWSLKDGKVVVNHQFDPGAGRQTSLMMLAAQGNNALEWVPDGSGWLLYGAYLVDRNTGRFVWWIGPGAGDQQPAVRKMLDTDHLLVVSGDRKELVLHSLLVPWKQIDTALKAITSGAPAHFKAGQPVRVNVEIADLRHGEADKVKTELLNTLAERLKAENVAVTDKSETTLHVRYREVDGQVLYRNDSPPSLPLAANTTFNTVATAIVVTTDGHLLTVAEPLGKATTVAVALADKRHPATVVTKDVDKNLALLKIDIENLTPLPLGDSADAEVGAYVWSIGFPAPTGAGSDITATRTKLTGIVQRDGRKMLQIGAAVSGYNVGGPLFDERGDVIGIAAEKRAAYAFSISDRSSDFATINDAKKFLSDQKVKITPPAERKKLDAPAVTAWAAGTARVSVEPPFSATFTATAPPKSQVPKPESIRGTHIECELSLRVSGDDKPVWTAQIVAEPSSVRVSAQPFEAKVRDGSFALCLSQVRQLPTLPYFVSKDSPPQMLPSITEKIDLPPQSNVASPAGEDSRTRSVPGAVPKESTRGQPATEGATPKATKRGR